MFVSLLLVVPVYQGAHRNNRFIAIVAAIPPLLVLCRTFFKDVRGEARLLQAHHEVRCVPPPMCLPSSRPCPAPSISAVAYPSSLRPWEACHPAGR